MKIERQKLFEMVWERPMYKLGPELGLSDRGLFKVCKRFSIPMPPLGYFWRETEQNKHGRFNPGTERSACLPFHQIIVESLSAGATLRAIHEKLKPLGFPGSFSAVQEYVAKLLRGQVRTIKSKNQFATFEYRRKVKPKPYEVERPPLPAGPEFVVFKEPGARSDAVSYPPPVDTPSPKCEFKGTAEKPAEAVKQPACGSIPEPAQQTFLDSLQPYLAYARKRYPEPFVATWLLAIGCDLPAGAWARLEWQHVRDDADGNWELVGPLTASGKTARYKVVPRAAQELREFRRSAGKVITKGCYQIRQQIAEILGPNWRRYAEEIRKTLLQNQPDFGIATPGWHS